MMTTTRIPNILSAAAAIPWAIVPEKLEAICALLELRANGGQVDAATRGAVAAAPRRPSAALGGAVAVIPIAGVIAPKVNVMTDMSGGTSAEQLLDQVRAAVENPQIAAVVLDVDSPGGSVAGVMECADGIRALRGQKPIVAVANYLMASAAYWIASAADEIVASPSAEVGHIGVFSVLTDRSGADAMEGLKRTLIKAGLYKGEDLPFFPTSDDAKAHVQEKVDAYYAQFVAAVAAGRGTTAAAVRAGYGQGLCLTAQAALEAKLVDRVATLDQVIGEFAMSPAGAGTATRSRLAATAITPAVVAALQTAVPPVLAAASAVIDDPEDLLDGGDDEEEEDDDEEGDEEGDEEEIPTASTTPTPSTTSATTSTPSTGPRGDAAGAPTTAPRTSTHRITTAPRGKETTVSDTDTTARNGADNERAREQELREIGALAEQHGCTDRLPKWLASGTPLDGPAGVRAEITGVLRERLAAGPQTKPRVDLSAQEQSRYSYARALLSALDGTACFEQDLNQELAKKIPQGYKPHGGFFMPTNIGVPFAAGLDTGTSTKGAELKYVQYGGFIAMLRNKARVIQAGARLLSGLDGPVTFAKQNGAGSFQWMPENGGADATDSNLLLTTVSLQAKTGMSTTSYSRQMLRMAVEDTESMVRDDLAAVHALGIDLAALSGPGTGNAPTGIKNQAGVGVVAIGTNGGAPTYNHLINQQVQIGQANADSDIGVGAYITTPGIKGTLQVAAKLANTIAEPVWGDDDRVAGRAGFSTNQVESNLTKGTGTNLHAIYYGIWQQLLIGEWGAMEILVDPLRLKKQGMIEVTSFQMIDIAVRYAAGFSIIKDAISTF